MSEEVLFAVQAAAQSQQFYSIVQHGHNLHGAGPGVHVGEHTTVLWHTGGARSCVADVQYTSLLLTRQ